MNIPVCNKITMNVWNISKTTFKNILEIRKSLGKIKNIVHATLRFIVEPVTEIAGGPDLFINKDSTINLTCYVRYAPEPPSTIIWSHNHQVSLTYDLQVKFLSLAENHLSCCHQVWNSRHERRFNWNTSEFHSMLVVDRKRQHKQKHFSCFSRSLKKVCISVGLTRISIIGGSTL